MQHIQYMQQILPLSRSTFDTSTQVVDGNTDTWVTKALPGGLPQHIKDAYKPGQWTIYMQVL
jgi:hypothetical protein